MQLDFSAKRRRRRWWLLPLAVLTLAALPRLAALPPAAKALAGQAVGAHYTARLDALQQENFALRQRLTQTADAEEENAALRQLAGCGRVQGAVLPARVTARWPGGMMLACPGAAEGRAVLDPSGHWVGMVEAVEGDLCRVRFAATAGLCGSYAGLVQPGQWELTDLPVDCTLAAGDIVTTPGGDWLGVLAAAPTPDADGLTAHAALTDTADSTAYRYFVRK